MTLDEAKKLKVNDWVWAYFKELKSRIASLKRENTRLLYPIREQLKENDKQISRLSGMLATLDKLEHEDSK